MKHLIFTVIFGSILALAPVAEARDKHGSNKGHQRKHAVQFVPGAPYYRTYHNDDRGRQYYRQHYYEDESGYRDYHPQRRYYPSGRQGASIRLSF